MNEDGRTGHAQEPVVPPQGGVPAQAPAQQAVPWGRPARKPAQQPVAPPAPAQWAAAPAAPQPHPEQAAFGPPPAMGPLPPPQSPGRGRAVLVGLLVGLLVLGAGGGVAWLLLGGDDSSGSSAAASSSSPERSRSAESTAADRDGDNEEGADASPGTPRSTRTPSSAPAPRVDPETQATTDLERMRAVSLQRLVLDGRWVAQVASKAVGITDPLQTTASGGNTFMAVDILAESQAARRLADPASVLTVQSTDFGKVSRWSNGLPFWVTLVDGGFGSSDQAQAWCDRTFASLPAEQRANTCAPRTLVPPYN